MSKLHEIQQLIIEELQRHNEVISEYNLMLSNINEAEPELPDDPFVCDIDIDDDVNINEHYKEMIDYYIKRDEFYGSQWDD